jgi:N-acetylmuramoyl-L-alanine amidase
MCLAPRVARLTGVLVLLAGCARPTARAPLQPLPTPNVATGPLVLSVVYPRLEGPPDSTQAAAVEHRVVAAESTYVIQATDSTFIFGSVGRGDAELTANGHPVPVYTTGGWIAWLPLTRDSVQVFDLVASTATDTARLTFSAPRLTTYTPPPYGAWIDTMSMEPVGSRWVLPGEGVRLAVRAVPDARVRLIAAGDTIAFIPARAPEPLPWGQRAFDRGAGGAARPVSADRYVAWHVGPLGPDPGPVLAPLAAPAPSDSSWATLEVIFVADTVRARWPVRLGVITPEDPRLAVVNDDTAGTGLTDSVLAGRPTPNGTYHWFFPTGTVARVSGRWNDQVRLQLSGRSVAWVDAVDVQPLHPGIPPPVGAARAMRLSPGPESVTLRMPLPARIPFRVDEMDRDLRVTLYGVAADMDWIQYGGTDPFVEAIAYEQPVEDETLVTVSLDERVWGYRTRWDGADLLLEIRRPPPIDAEHPLAGRRIALDPGHPPGGATGPTGVREPDVVLGAALKAATLLRRHGAEVVLLRHSDSAVGLVERVVGAERADADVLVSIHANALPDGVNPFVNNGTSVYYFHPRSISLARFMDRALVRHFGFRDLGIGRGDLALARPTWMPAVLLEGLFMMLPDQEAVLASEAGQWRYARGIVEGLEGYLRWYEQGRQGR